MKKKEKRKEMKEKLERKGKKVKGRRSTNSRFGYDLLAPVTVADRLETGSEYLSYLSTTPAAVGQHI